MINELVSMPSGVTESTHALTHSLNHILTHSLYYIGDLEHLINSDSYSSTPTTDDIASKLRNRKRSITSTATRHRSEIANQKLFTKLQNIMLYRYITHSHLLTHLLAQLLTHSYLLTYSLTHVLTYSFTHSLTYSLTLTRLLTYSLAYLLISLIQITNMPEYITIVGIRACF